MIKTLSKEKPNCFLKLLLKNEQKYLIGLKVLVSQTAFEKNLHVLNKTCIT